MKEQTDTCLNMWAEHVSRRASNHRPRVKPHVAHHIAQVGAQCARGAVVVPSRPVSEKRDPAQLQSPIHSTSNATGPVVDPSSVTRTNQAESSETLAEDPPSDPFGFASWESYRSGGQKVSCLWSGVFMIPSDLTDDLLGGGFRYFCFQPLLGTV